MVAGDLVSAVLGEHHRLQASDSDRVERRKMLAGAIQTVALLYANSMADDAVELTHPFWRQPGGQA
jgi:hypothetical protein